MPTYEYACEKCGKTFKAYQSMRDEAYQSCPKELCQQAKWGKGKVKRLLGTGAGLIFKGSGFYITDYRSTSYKEGAKKEAPGGGEKSAGESSGGKPETKTSPGKKPESPAKHMMRLRPSAHRKLLMPAKYYMRSQYLPGKQTETRS